MVRSKNGKRRRGVMKTKTEQLIRWAAILLCITLGGGLLFLLLRYLFPVLIPFLIAWVIALAITPTAKRLAKRTSLPEKLCSVLLLLLTLLGIFLLLGLAVRRLTRELGSLMEGLLRQYGSFEEMVYTWMDGLRDATAQIGIFGDAGDTFPDKLSDMVSGMLTGIFTSLASKLPSLAGGLLGALPKFLFGAVITVISAFYVCVDRDRILSVLTALLPRRAREKMPHWRARLRLISWRYLRAYLLLLLITFTVLLVGFLWLDVPYAFLLAMLAAVVDLLPVLGVGTVLLPWAAVVLLQKRFYLGFGLLILYGTVTVVRQIAEPRLVGKSLGVHPLLTVFFTYVGWSVSGIFGMLLAPFAAWIARSVYLQISKTEEGREKD